MSSDTLPSFADIDPNALNMAAAANIQVLSMINKTMDEVRSQESFSISLGIKAAFGIAAAMMTQGVFAAMSSGLGAIGGMKELSTMKSTESKLSPAVQKLQKKDEEFGNNLKELENKKMTPEEKASKRLELNEERGKNKALLGDKKTEIQDAKQKANIHTNILNMASQGGKALSDGILQTLQEQQKAVQSVAQSLQQMFGGSYSKAQQVLGQYLNIDFFKALGALATSIQ